MNLATIAASAPAGGAATQDIVLATGGALVLTTLVVVTGVLYRSGQVRWLQKLADFSERQWGVPAWVALSGEIATVSLLIALAGMYWDISLHIDNGRDPGPLANPAHYLILFGLFGVFVAGFFSIIMGDHRGGSSMIKRASTWKIPVGGIMLFACASFSLLGFPLDDGWHRIFGQDVTLWGPTHLMLFGGAGMTLLGRATLLVEGERAARREREQNGNGAASSSGIPGRHLMNLQKAGLMGGFLIGMSTFQGEFDFGVPQFQMVFHPMLIAFAAGIALVTARLWGGRWAALVAVAFFIGIRGLVSIFVDPVMGQTLPHFPLYIAEGLLVEGVAFLISTRNPIRFGAISGLAIGTIGFAAEWAWSHVWMPLPWPSSLMPEGLICAIVAGLAGGLLGALIGSALSSDTRPFPTRGVVPSIAIAAVMIFVMVGYGLKVNNDAHASATFRVHTVPAPSGVKDNKPGRWAEADIKLNPPTAADDSKWVTITAWQGGALVVDRVQKIAQGVYRSTKPFPVHADWKALLRIHRGDELLGSPIYLPNDPAIPVKGVPAKPLMTRPIGSDHHILQREAKSTSGILPIVAYLAVLSIALGLCVLMGWGLARLARDGDAGLPDKQEGTAEKAWIQRPAGTGAATPA